MWRLNFGLNCIGLLFQAYASSSAAANAQKRWNPNRLLIWQTKFVSERTRAAGTALGDVWMCKVIRGERAILSLVLYQIPQVLFQRQYLLSIYPRLRRKEGEKYSMAERGCVQSGSDGCCKKIKETESCSAKNMSQCFSECYTVKNRQNNVNTQGPAATEPRGNNESNWNYGGRWGKIITRQCAPFQPLSLSLLVFNYSNAVRTESSRRLSLSEWGEEKNSRSALNIAEKEQSHEMQSCCCRCDGNPERVIVM